MRNVKLKSTGELFELSTEKIKNKELQLAVPDVVTQQHLKEIKEAIDYAKQYNITLKVSLVKK